MTNADLIEFRRKAELYDQIRANNSKAGRTSSAKLTAEERKKACGKTRCT